MLIATREQQFAWIERRAAAASTSTTAIATPRWPAAPTSPPISTLGSKAKQREVRAQHVVDGLSVQKWPGIMIGARLSQTAA